MRPKSVRARDVERVVLQLGFRYIRSKGSHRFYRHEDGRIVTMAFHARDIPTGTLRAIIRQIGLTVEQFNELV